MRNPTYMGDQTWIHKGLATITRMARPNVQPVVAQRSANPLRDIFTDLIAFIIFFRSSCEKQPPDQSELRDRIIALANAQEERIKTAGISGGNFCRGALRRFCLG
jgi:hypothetical protein